MLFFSGSVTVSATTGLQFEQMVDFGRAWSCRSKDGFVYKGSECESYSATRLKLFCNKAKGQSEVYRFVEEFTAVQDEIDGCLSRLEFGDFIINRFMVDVRSGNN
ncbi:hypothetical protein C5167_003769 [Papaver somniferum]|uniref:Uncharacterized protein n=1 Tax=Papaver somniferum TaxID=3469 RepID=A0A4Y7L3K6_PAPSO|nr:hypothetical protein C5167_003769 [Papaver somniferum]